MCGEKASGVRRAIPSIVDLIVLCHTYIIMVMVKGVHYGLVNTTGLGP